VHVPLQDTLAQHMIKMDSDAAEERQKLKRHILAAAADHQDTITHRRW